MIITTHNHLGDHVCLTAVAHNLYEVTGQKTQILKNQYSSIYQNNPYIELVQGQAIKAVYPGTQKTGDCGNLCAAYTKSVFQQLHIEAQIKYTKPQLYTCKRQTHDYVVICSGYQINCTVKNWGRLNWQTFINSHRNTHFIQVGALGPIDVQPSLYGDNLQVMVGKTQLKDLIQLVANAKGVVGYSTAVTHIAAAFNVPAIAIIGNRESFHISQYPNVKHAENKLPCGPCMKFYAGAGTEGKCCTQPVCMLNQIVRQCMAQINIDKLFEEHIVGLSDRQTL